MVQSRNNGGWTVSILIPEAALKMWYRIGEEGEFIDNGVGAYNDPRTGQPAPNTNISLPADQGPTTIYIKYLNANGEEMGPFALAFVTSSALVEEPGAARARSAATRRSACDRSVACMVCNIL